MKKIISWNVASIRARLPLLTELIQTEQPDVVCVQEIKTQQDQFPYNEIENLGYHAYISGQKAWNGVAVLSKEPLVLKSTALKGFEDQARFVEAQDSQDLSYISVYVPNGQAPANNPDDTSRLEYKLNWLEALYQYLKNKKHFIIAGDFNVIQKDKDVYNPESFKDSVLMLPEVREKFEQLTSLSIRNPMRDLYPEGGLYTFWDFRRGAWFANNGIGLDYIFLSQDLFANSTINADILKDYRGKEKTSDHAPICVKIDI